MKYFPHTAEDVREMLAVIGVNSLDELYAEVPEELKYKGELNLPHAMSESEVRATIDERAADCFPAVIFAGQGAYNHYTPSVIPYITARSEFSTSYTPYQAEISQGTLAYIFEYQTMMARLTGMDISNASMYDGATATAEAMMMCVANAKKRNRVLMSDAFLPAVQEVVKTYAHYHGVQLEIVPTVGGLTNVSALCEAVAQDDVAGVLVAQPNRYGLVENFEGLADACHEHKALLAINTVASALAVLKTPGEWGADIACGDAQSLGIPVGYGGPYIGYMCVKNALVRKMPGRLVGQTVDANGQRCFVLTMQAREQHIRREKATSNICTAQGYMCLYVASYLSLMGAKGLQEVNERSYQYAHALKDGLLATGLFEDPYEGKAFLNEFTLRYTGEYTLEALRDAMAAEGFVFGAPAGCCERGITFAATEENTREQIEVLLEALEELHNPINEEEDAQ